MSISFGNTAIFFGTILLFFYGPYDSHRKLGISMNVIHFKEAFLHACSNQTPHDLKNKFTMKLLNNFIISLSSIK